MSELIKDNEIILNLTSKSSTNSEEINKLYESLLDVRRIMTEELSFQKLLDLKELPFRLIEIENELKNSFTSIEALKNELLGESIYFDPITNEKTSVSFKEFVKIISSGLKYSSERIENLFFKLECLNSEILLRVKKDLANESTRILEEFRINLKNSLLKIEQQMNDKVDRFNFDDFNKKLDVKIFQAISKKLDRTDLKKNNNLMNKKVILF